MNLSLSDSRALRRKVWDGRDARADERMMKESKERESKLEKVLFSQ